MKNCKGCKHASWNRTAAGKLHPNGDGRCSIKIKLPPLPASFFWITDPNPSGGWISRKRDLKDHCAYYAREDRK